MWFWLKWILKPSLFVNGINMTLCAKRVWIYPKLNIFPNLSIIPIQQLSSGCVTLSGVTTEKSIPGYPFIFNKNACFLCTLCGDVTTFFYFDPKYTIQNPSQNKQVCPKFINVIIENNLSHKSCAKSTLCNVAIKGCPLLSHTFIRACPFCFAMTWFPSATSMCLTVSSNKPGIKY